MLLSTKIITVGLVYATYFLVVAFTIIVDHFRATGRVIMAFFQKIDFSRPVRYRKLEHDKSHVDSICVSGRWLVALHWNPTAVQVYSLPGLQPECKLPDDFSVCQEIRADSEGHVFGGCRERIAMLEISETGNLTFSRNLTAGGRLDGRRNTVAVGFTPGQLWVGCWYADDGQSCDIYLIDIDNDTVMQKIDSNGYRRGLVSQLLTGELLIKRYRTIQLYQSDVTLPPTNLTVTGWPLLSHRNHFLLRDWGANTILILDSQGDLVHTVDDLNGKHGICMKMRDVAVWENNLLVCDEYGNVMFLSMQ